MGRFNNNKKSLWWLGIRKDSIYFVRLLCRLYNRSPWHSLERGLQELVFKLSAPSRLPWHIFCVQFFIFCACKYLALTSTYLLFIQMYRLFTNIPLLSQIHSTYLMYKQWPGTVHFFLPFEKIITVSCDTKF